MAKKYPQLVKLAETVMKDQCAAVLDRFYTTCINSDWDATGLLKTKNDSLFKYADHL